MTVYDMWVRHLDSLDESERYSEIQRYHTMYFEYGDTFSEVVSEYLMFMHDGTVAPMPDMRVWE